MSFLVLESSWKHLRGGEWPKGVDTLSGDMDNFMVSVTELDMILIRLNLHQENCAAQRNKTMDIIAEREHHIISACMSPLPMGCRIAPSSESTPAQLCYKSKLMVRGRSAVTGEKKCWVKWSVAVKGMALGVAEVDSEKRRCLV